MKKNYVIAQDWRFWMHEAESPQEAALWAAQQRASHSDNSVFAVYEMNHVGDFNVEVSVEIKPRA